MKKVVLFWLMGCLLSTAVFTGCSSQVAPKEPAYPTRQIEYVIPAGAGGVTDLVARAVAEYLSKEWGKPILVVNKPGAGNLVGMEYALKQGKPDGYTVLADNISCASMMIAGMETPPIKLEDRIFVSKIVEDPEVYSVKSDAPWKDIREVSEWVKKNPEELAWAGLANTGVQAFCVSEWLQAIGADYSKTRMINAKSGNDSVVLVAGGNANLCAQTVAESRSLVSAGKVRMLAVSSKKRSPFIPDVPTMDEMGIKFPNLVWWTGVSMPKGTPDYIVKKWDTAIAKMTKDPVFIEKMNKIGSSISYMSSAELTESVIKETEHLTQVAKKAGMRK